MRYRLRTLVIVLAVMPPVLAGVWFLAQSPLGGALLAIALWIVASRWLAPPDESRFR